MYVLELHRVGAEGPQDTQVLGIRQCGHQVSCARLDDATSESHQ